MITIRIRNFTILSLLLVFLLPWIFFLAGHFMETKTFRFVTNEAEQEKVEQAVRLVENHPEKWTDAAWQSQLSRQLEEMGLGASILSGDNQVIFQTNAGKKPAFAKTERFSVVQDGSVIGRVAIYESNPRAIQMMAAIAGFFLALVIIGVAMRRLIIKPLEELSLHAREVAKGDFDGTLPPAAIAEMAEVREGFRVLVSGLKESFRKQVELEEERRFVMAAMAHDLRTPLFALRGYLDGLTQGIARSPEKMAKYVAVCKEKSAQLDRLVEDLFTYAKTEYPDVGLRRQSVDLSGVIGRSIQSLRLQARQKNISIVENAVEPSCMISGDAHLLERAWTNLLENAVRHTPDDGEIVVQCRQQDGKVTFAVRDSGQGFSEEELRCAFEPLYRGEGSRSRATGGAGLGLTISRRIIRQHGGDLAVANHAEGGALLSGWISLENRQIDETGK